MTTNSPMRWKFSTAALAVVLALVIMPAPTHGASDNTNLIQQILMIVQNIQTILVGTDVGVSSLQSDVSAIKAKTDNLPADTATTLNEIKGAVGGYGPLNRTLMQSFTLNAGQSAVTFACTSPGPFLLHLHGQGDYAVITGALNGSPGYYQIMKSGQSVYIVLGGGPGDVINVQANLYPTATAAYVFGHITMQYVDGQIASCNFAGT